jgi:hypothetical protein
VRDAGTSVNLTNTLGPSTQLVIRTQPSPTATTGKAFAIQPVIDEEDQYGNLETGDNSTRVTASLRVGAGPLQGTTNVTVSDGIAAFANLADSKVETIVLVFTGSGLAKATSNTIIVGPASAKAQLVSTFARVGGLLVKAGSVHPGFATGRAIRRRNNPHAIRDASLPATTKAHTGVAMTARPSQSRAVPALELASPQAAATANRARALLRADSVFVRAPAVRLPTSIRCRCPICRNRTSTGGQPRQFAVSGRWLDALTEPDYPVPPGHSRWRITVIALG